MSAALVLVVALLAPAAQETGETDWPGVWDRVDALDPADPGARTALAAELADLAAGPGARAALLALRLGLEEDPTRLVTALSAADPWPLDPRESLSAVDRLPPGAQRVVAAVRGLRGLGRDATREELLAVWRAGVDESRALRLAEGALPVQELLHERFRATWSAEDLALTLSALGRPEADRVLADQIQVERAAGHPTGELWARRGIAALGLGNDAAARDYLGRAWALGAADGALVLARIELERGRRETARVVFGGLLREPDPSPWALRGFGLAHLPEVRVPPGTTSASVMTPDGT